MLRQICHPKLASTLLFFFVAVAMIGVAELMVRVVTPQATMLPRYEFSERYNTALPPDTEIRHQKPGVFSFTYTINSDGYRGPQVVPNPERGCIVILGDSYSFGTGVGDGEEYPHQMRLALDHEIDILNLGTPGWGIPQQIRKYFEIENQYRPSRVILQFCRNDPLDGKISPVAEWTNGEFTFHPIGTSNKRYAKFLARSPIQKSQLYNYVRNRIWLLSRQESPGNRANSPEKKADRKTDMEETYVDLLVPFADYLHRNSIPLLLISVDRSVQSFPIIHRTVKLLSGRGQMNFVDVEPWLAGLMNAESPEGHHWGTSAHAEIGKGLAGWVRKHPLTGSTGTE